MERINERNLRFFTFVLFWSGLIVISSLYITIPLLSVFESEFSISPNQAAWSGSIFSIFFAIGCLFFGILAEKFGLKRVMVYGLVFLSFNTFMVGFSSSFNQILFFRAVQGIAAATFSPVALTYVGTMFPQEKRATTIGIISSGFLMAGIVGQLASSFIEQIFNWNAVFYSFALIYAATVIMLMVFPKDVIETDKDMISVIKMIAIPFCQKPVLFAYGIAITILLSFVGMYTALGEYLTVQFGFDRQQIFFVRAAGIVGILLSPFTGKFTKILGLHYVLNAGLVISIVSLFVMSFSHQLKLIIIMSLLFVAGIALIVPTLISLVGQLGGIHKGIFTSVYTFVLFIGASLGPVLATFIMRFGESTLPFIIFGSLLTIGLILSFYMHAGKQMNNAGREGF